MIVIRCAKCKRKIFTYQKIGKGRVLRCYKDRIVRFYPVRDLQNVECLCGQVIGFDEGRWIRMKQSAFECSGSIKKR